MTATMSLRGGREPGQRTWARFGARGSPRGLRGARALLSGHCEWALGQTPHGVSISFGVFSCQGVEKTTLRERITNLEKLFPEGVSTESQKSDTRLRGKPTSAHGGPVPSVVGQSQARP
jgi:hypothetical protein